MAKSVKLKIEPELATNTVDKQMLDLQKTFGTGMGAELAKAIETAAAAKSVSVAQQIKTKVGAFVGAAGGTTAAGITAFAHGHGVGAATGAAHAVGGALMSSGNPYAAAGGAALEGITKIFDVIGSFVGKANPALMERLGDAFDDISGVIGQALAPAIEMLLPLIRNFGDFIASIIPDQEVLNNFFKEFQPLMDAVGNAMADLAPAINQVLTLFIDLEAYMVGNLVQAFKIVMKAITDIYNMAVDLINKLPGSSLLGLKRMDYTLGESGEGGPNFKRSARGAAHREASFTGIEELSKGFQQAAFSSGTQDPAIRTAEGIEAMQQKLDQMYNDLRNNFRAPNLGGGGEY